MRSSIRVSCFCLLLASALPGASSRAELPPEVYRAQQEKAAEALQVKVVSVTGRETKKKDHAQLDYAISCGRAQGEPT